MNPQQDLGGNPYDFIMNPGQQQKKPGIVGGVGGNGFIMKLVAIVGGMVVLMIAIAIGINLIAGSKVNITDLISLAQTQTELARVAQEGNQATNGNVKNVAIATQLTVATQQAQLSKYVLSHGHKLTAKELGAKKNTATDVQLNNALQSSTYDLAFTQILDNQITSYESLLKQYYANAVTPTVRTMLSTDYQQVQLLAQQVPSQTSLQT